MSVEINGKAYHTRAELLAANLSPWLTGQYIFKLPGEDEEPPRPVLTDAARERMAAIAEQVKALRDELAGVDQKTKRLADWLPQARAELAAMLGNTDPESRDEAFLKVAVAKVRLECGDNFLPLLSRRRNELSARAVSLLAELNGAMDAAFGSRMAHRQYAHPNSSVEVRLDAAVVAVERVLATGNDEDDLQRLAPHLAAPTMFA
jgi:hypothetical protein